MCGIVGYIGERRAPDVIWESLLRLEYRGYDSAGIAVLNGKGISTAKCKGRLKDLKALLKDLPESTLGIGHTRWATHGAPSDGNAHPHKDCTGKITLVHNGIIENHRELRKRLIEAGHKIVSDTDSELCAHLIEEKYQGDILEALKEAVGELEGSMALLVLHQDEPDKIAVYREKSPLIIGLGHDENFVASDVPAILPYTRTVAVLNDGEFALVKKKQVTIFDSRLNRISREPITFDLTPEDAEKAGFDHFMLKEIYEQPEALDRALSSRIRDGRICLEKTEFGMTEDQVKSLKKIYLVACGTAYHACLVGRNLIQNLSGIPAEAALASEFRYEEPLIPQGTLCIFLSQSGETADTLAAVREARQKGARIMAITNSPISSLAREAQDVLYQRAGPEIAVASTKAYTTQVACLALTALYLGRLRGTLAREKEEEFVSDLKSVPKKAQSVLRQKDAIERVAGEIYEARDVFFIGRGADYLSAMEGQLKLKEISYIHAEAYAAGELKHGTLALISPGVPVVALLTDPKLAAKTASNIMEVKARGGRIIAVGTKECLLALNLDESDRAIEVPQTLSLISPCVAMIPLQLLSYYVARNKGTDIDKPRNLAKSVTVE